MEELFEPRIDLTALNLTVTKIREELSRVIIGQKEMVDLLITAILSDGHVLIEGVPGIAKTLAAKLMAKTMSVDFKRIQFTPDLMPSDIIGTSVFNPSLASFEFKKGPVFSNIILIDEINRAPAKTQSALFEVMEERQISIDGITYIMDKPFLVFATQNPLEHEGTYRLPEAQLDRFMFKIEVGYPTLEEEVIILDRNNDRKGKKEIDEVIAVMDMKQLLTYQDLVKQILIKDNLKMLIAQIINKTRNHGSLYLSASPRASINIMNASKTYAAMQGRDFVTPDDIRMITPHVLKHRIILTPEKEMEGKTPNDIINEIISSIEIPR